METGSAPISLATQSLQASYIKLPRAIYVWVGTGEAATMASLVSAVPGTLGSQSAVTTLLGSTDAEDLAARLSRRTGRLVLLSFDAADGVTEELAQIEAQIFQLIK